MKISARKSKIISCLLIGLILLQSCVIYRVQNYNPDEISKFSDDKIKIITTAGDKYKLDWMEVTDENLFSRINVNRDFLKKEDIETLMVNNPTREISIEEAVNHKGNIYVRTKDAPKPGKNNYKMYNHIFLDVEDAGEYLRVYTMLQPDTLTETVN